MKNAYHILRYGTHADQKFFIEGKDTYTTIAINGNMIAHSPAAIASFFSSMKLQNPRLSYFIDPITHAFQHDLIRLMTDDKKEDHNTKIFNPEKLKKSIKTLIDLYGKNLSKILINCKRSLFPTDFNQDFIKEFCEGVIDYQYNVLTNELEKVGVLDYIRYAKNHGVIETIFTPAFIIAPYFYMDYEWLPINIEMLKYCLSKYPDHNITAQIVLSQDILSNHRSIIDIASQYISCTPKQIMLWIDDFDEQTTYNDLLSNLLLFLAQFRKVKIPVINLYGGYFSEILIKLGYLNGVGHALEYGECRSVIPVGGGLPQNKYYFYDLHTRLNYSVASDILFKMGFFNKEVPQSERYERYKKEICHCPICKRILKQNMNNFQLFECTKPVEFHRKSGDIQKRMFANATTKEKCIMHYQYSKYREFKELENIKIEDIINSIRNCFYRYKSFFSKGELVYLENWIASLEKLEMIKKNER